MSGRVVPWTRLRPRRLGTLAGTTGSDGGSVPLHGKTVKVKKLNFNC